MKKDKVLQTVNELPSEFNLEDLIEKLIFIEKVEEGIKAANEGKTISHQKLKEEIKKW